jgi:hypothetical protein
MEPNFAELYEENEVILLEDAYRAVTLCAAWDWLKEFKPHPNEGFMFTTEMTVAEIHMRMKHRGHSGSSFAWTMRTMQSIAKHGWEGHKKMVVDSSTKPCHCRRERGKLVGWCGVAGGGVPACDH